MHEIRQKKEVLCGDLPLFLHLARYHSTVSQTHRARQAWIHLMDTVPRLRSEMAGTNECGCVGAGLS